MMKEKELMDDLFNSEIEARKLENLALYFHHLQLNGEASLGFSHINKENYGNLK